MKYQDYMNYALEEEDLVERDATLVPQQYDKHDDFSLAKTGRRYDHQFFSMYQARLEVLKKRVDSSAHAKWGDGTSQRDGQTIHKVDKILNISSNKVCWVSGTVYCDLNNKLNILKDVENGTDDVLPQVPDSYSSENGEEVVMLEDDSGRAVLHGDFLQLNILVTGMVIAVLGIELQAGMFEILDVVYPQMSPVKLLHVSNDTNTKNTIANEPKTSTKIAFVSGLGIANSANYDIKLELLRLYIQGELGTGSDKQACAEISQLVIAGNSISEIEQTANDAYVSLNNYGSKNVSRYDPESLKLFDRFISEIAATCQVAVMPGNSDPTDVCLPQQPLHRSFFLSCKNYVGSNIHSLTNPSWLEVNGVRMLGTSGQNVKDVFKYLSPEKRKEPGIETRVMKAMIQWQNIAPTAPDTLYCYPFDNTDPFTLRDETPHVYFVGNQKCYDSQVYKEDDVEVRVVSIPEFAQTGEIVVLDTASLETSVIRII